jgi:hypothetical protein
LGSAESLWRVIDEVCRQRRAAFLKWEPGILEAGSPPRLRALWFPPERADDQPPRTILIDISADDDTILAREPGNAP